MKTSLSGKTVPWEQALSALDKKFTTSAKSRLSTVLLVDEVCNIIIYSLIICIITNV